MRADNWADKREGGAGGYGERRRKAEQKQMAWRNCKF
jgi:hypothetical protein